MPRLLLIVYIEVFRRSNIYWEIKKYLKTEAFKDNIFKLLSEFSNLFI